MRAKAFVCVPGKGDVKSVTYTVAVLPRFILWIIRCWMKVKGASEDALSELRKERKGTGD